MVLYMVSISCQQKLLEVYHDDFFEIITWLFNNIKLSIRRTHYEYGIIYHQLHAHCIFDIKEKHFRWKPYTQYGSKKTHIKTFHIDWRKINNLSGAIKYITKDIGKSTLPYPYSHYFFNISTQQFESISPAA